MANDRPAHRFINSGMDGRGAGAEKQAGRRLDGNCHSYSVYVERLPVDAILDDIRAALAAGPNLVLEAPPGAGKTTRVPPALLDLLPGQILVLEPRRLAARLAAGPTAAYAGAKRQLNEWLFARMNAQLELEAAIHACEHELYPRAIGLIADGRNVWLADTTAGVVYRY